MGAGIAFSRVAAGFPRVRRAGVHARRTLAVQNRDVRAAAGPGGMRASRPTFARAARGNPVWPVVSRTACRGGACPSRTTTPPRTPPWTMRASSRPALPRTPAGGPWPSLQTGANIVAPGLPGTQNFPVGGGICPARGTLRYRGVRRDEGIPPYVRPGRGRGKPIWPVVPGCHVGEGHAPPANPAPPRTGRIWNPPLRCTAGGCIFPGGRRVCPGSVGRAFTPARTLAVQNRDVRLAPAGCGGMRASRPTFARAAAASPFGRSCPDAM